MFVELLVRDEETNTLRVMRVNATQVVVRNGASTPILAVAAEYGTSRSQIVAKVGDQDFTDSLRKLGIFDTVTVDRIQLSKPVQGAKLVRAPASHNGGQHG